MRDAGLRLKQEKCGSWNVQEWRRWTKRRMTIRFWNVYGMAGTSILVCCGIVVQEATNSVCAHCWAVQNINSFALFILFLFCFVFFLHRSSTFHFVFVFAGCARMWLCLRMKNSFLCLLRLLRVERPYERTNQWSCSALNVHYISRNNVP